MTLGRPFYNSAGGFWFFHPATELSLLLESCFHFFPARIASQVFFFFRGQTPRHKGTSKRPLLPRQVQLPLQEGHSGGELGPALAQQRSGQPAPAGPSNPQAAVNSTNAATTRTTLMSLAGP